MTAQAVEPTPAQVRDWLREQGEEVTQRGRVKAEDLARYRAAHGLPEPEPDGGEPGAGLAAYDGGVSAADFPEDPDMGEPDLTPEVAPRRVRMPKAAASKPRGGALARLTGRSQSGGGRKRRPRKPPRPRVPVTDLIEDTWASLAWAAQDVPPLYKIFTIQAPYAGLVLEEAVADTPVDRVLQPLARYQALGQIMTGLAGPPIAIAGMLTVGQDHPAFKMLKGMLRYSLLAMAKAGKTHWEEAIERVQENITAGREVDQLIEFLFTIDQPPAPGDGAAQAAADQEMAAKMRAAFGQPG